MVRDRIDAVASAVDGAPDGDVGQPPTRIGSAWHDAGFSAPSETPRLFDGDQRNEASDAEVAAAIPNVSDDGNREADENGNEEDRDDIIVA